MASYVLLTAARNEEKYIGVVINSAAQQTILPIRWIIVDDGSTDGTFASAMKAAKDLQAVQIIRRRAERGVRLEGDLTESRLGGSQGAI